MHNSSGMKRTEKYNERMEDASTYVKHINLQSLFQNPNLHIICHNSSFKVQHIYIIHIHSAIEQVKEQLQRVDWQRNLIFR